LTDFKLGKNYRVRVRVRIATCVTHVLKVK